MSDQRQTKKDEDYNESVHLTRLRETRDEVEDREILESACSTQNGSGPPISAWNLLSALQVSITILKNDSIMYLHQSYIKVCY